MDPSISSSLKKKLSGNLNLLIWTTTPWTLPSNVAVAVNENEDYGVYPYGQDFVILASKLEANWKEKVELGEAVTMLKGKDLLSFSYELPFADSEGKVVAMDYVSMEDGTGLVHTAPGHGPDDFLAALKWKLRIVCPVDSKGNYFKKEAFQEELGVKDLSKDLLDLCGVNIFDAQEKILASLKKRKTLLWSGTISHSVAHCWRTKKPIIFRATPQWLSLIHI